MSGGNQNISTPWQFIKAVEDYFSLSFKYDMAADASNAKAPKYFTKEDNSFSIDWPLDGWCWLNPTFINLTKWINKCHEQYELGVKIITIWPLSGDQNQINVWKKIGVNVLHGRIWPEVRGCMLCEWGDKKYIRGLAWNKERLEKIWEKK